MRLVASFCVFLVTVAAQEVTSGSWERVQQLTAGNPVRVRDFSGNEHRGRIASLETDSLAVQTGTGTVKVGRNDIREVKTRRLSGRARNAGIGAAVGAGLGLGTAGILVSAAGGGDLAAPILIVFTLVGGAIGFGLGWIPAGYVTLYRARR